VLLSIFVLILFHWVRIKLHANYTLDMFCQLALSSIKSIGLEGISYIQR